MNTVQIGRQFEKKAIIILEKEGYKIISEDSKKNWGCFHDFTVKKRGLIYYVEVRGRKNGRDINSFIIHKNKLDSLKEKGKEAIILCINRFGYAIFQISELKMKSSIKKGNICLRKIYFIKRQNKDLTRTKEFKKKLIIKFLKKGKPLSAIYLSVFIHTNYPRALELLEELEKEKKVKKIVETNSTYWEGK